MRRTSYSRGLVGVAALAIGALGCGGSELGPRDTTEAFFEAVGNGDGAKACSYITDEVLLSEGRSQAECAQDLTFAPDDSDRDEYAGASANIVSVEEDGDRATVTMTDFEYERIELTQADGEWRISQFVD